MNQAQKIQSGIDFDSILAGADKRVTVKVPVLFDDDGEPKAGFLIVGKNSPEYRGVNHAVRSEGYQRSARRKTAIDSATEEGSSQLVHLVDASQSRIALAVAVETFGFTSGGADVQLTEAQKVAAFAKFPTWQDLIIGALEKDADFLKV